jgi:hypothetical protein
VNPRCFKFTRYSHQQRGLAVRARAVSQRYGVARRLIGTMQESAYQSFLKRFDHRRCAREIMSS